MDNDKDHAGIQRRPSGNQAQEEEGTPKQPKNVQQVLPIKQPENVNDSPNLEIATTTTEKNEKAGQRYGPETPPSGQRGTGGLSG